MLCILDLMLIYCLSKLMPYISIFIQHLADASSFLQSKQSIAKEEPTPNPSLIGGELKSFLLGGDLEEASLRLSANSADNLEYLQGTIYRSEGC